MALDENLRVLTIDDSMAIAKILKHYLKKFGTTNVVSTLNGKDGLETFNEAKKNGEDFQLVFCDWAMPIMNGMEFLTTFRSDHSNAHVPVIMLTAEVSKENALEAFGKGANAYLYKPFTINELRKKIERVLHISLPEFPEENGIEN